MYGARRGLIKNRKCPYRLNKIRKEKYERIVYILDIFWTYLTVTIYIRK